MKKKLFSLLLALALSALLLLPALADFQQVERHLPLVVDDVGVLSEEEDSALNELAEQILRTYNMEAAVIFIDTTDDYTIRDMADDIYDYYGYGAGVDDDGLLLLIAVYDREYWITTHAAAIPIFTDSRIRSIGSGLESYLGDDNWYAGAQYFLSQAARCMEGGEPEKPPLPVGPIALGALVLGAALGFIPVSIMKGKMNSAAKKVEAMDYVKAEEARLTGRWDTFLGRHEHRVRIESSSSSSTHHSSSGRSHGGGGGRF